MAAKQSDKMAVQCPHCENTALSSVGGETRWSIEEADTAGRYILASCDVCQMPILFSQDIDTWTDAYSPPVVVYPTSERTFGGNIPPSVRIAFEEAEICFNAGAHTATPLMCRRCIEAITADKGATGRTLQARLRSMETNGIISGEFSKWFDMLRQVGNQAAHDVAAPVSPSDARDTLEFTHALLEFIYSYRQKFEEFQARRSPNGAP